MARYVETVGSLLLISEYKYDKTHLKFSVEVEMEV